MNFVHLHVHTEYSSLDGFGTPKQFADRLVELGQGSIASTDHGNIYSHVPFNKEFKKRGLHFIFGCEMYVVEELTKERGYYHLTVLAKNNKGYQNLLWLANTSNKQLYYKPRITFEQVSEHSEGLIFLSGCFCDGWFVKKGTLDKWNKWFNKVEWYLELQPFLDERVKWDSMVDMAKRHGLPCVVTFDTHYLRSTDKATHDIMLAINTNKALSDPDRLKLEYPLHLVSWDEAVQRCQKMGTYQEEWLSITSDIAASCDVTLPRAKMVSVGADISVIRAACEKRLAELGLHTDSTYVDRLAYELKLIHEKKFQDYFMIVWDLMTWARERMLCSPGRGSSAGSLACFLLGITAVDPLKYGLLFHRFISEERSDLPDIDLDFPGSRRAEVIAYLRHKYGEDKTAQLITFNTFKPRGILQAVGRILKIPIWEVKEAASQLIDRSSGDSRAEFCLADSVEQFDKLKAFFKKHPEGLPAVYLEGQTSNVGKHAAALGLSDTPLEEVGVLNEGIFSIDKAEESGLLKIDILGLDTLDVLHDLCVTIGMPWQDVLKLPLDDPKVYEDIFIPAKLEGVFQFEGMSVRQVCKEVKPCSFDQIAHVNALARPGAMGSGSAAEYIRRNNGGEYSIDPLLAPFTSNTLGMILFQEQVMQAVRQIGKFTWEDTGTIRRAMSKNLGVEFFNRFLEKFIVGAAQDGIPEDKATEIFKQVNTHGKWSFNSAHSYSYSILSYYTAWFKAYYPAQFYARILRGSIDEEEIRPILREWGGPFTAIDINKSKVFFSVAEDGSLIGGFTNIKGIGVAAAEKIVKGQPYDSLEDFKSRVPAGVAKKVEEAFNGGILWADMTPISQKVAAQIDALKLSSPLRSFVDFVGDPKAKSGVVLGRVIHINLKNANEEEKVLKRGFKINGPEEYVVLKIHDDFFNLHYICFDRYYTAKNKQQLLGTNGKICLFRVKKMDNNMLIGEKVRELSAT